MKAPVHIKCARSGELCRECQEKVNSGLVSNLDLEVIRALSKIEEKFNTGEVVFKKSLRVNNILFILLESDVSQVIGRRGRILKELKKELNAKIRLINATSKDKIVKDTLYPVEPKYISTVFKLGSKVLKIVIPKNSSRLLATRKETLEQALTKILGMKTKIVEE